ncbi:MAG: D-aminoacyl-tRNA deacylase [Bryobacteraceae bacterium]
MRTIIQRVKEARVEVAGRVTGSIGAGMLALLGIAKTDTRAQADYLVDKLLHLRIFPDAAGRFNRSLLETGGGLLVVSQFTLLADCSKGRRPSFDLAAEPAMARDLYEYFIERAREYLPVETGEFRHMMDVHLINDGPVTLLCEGE